MTARFHCRDANNQRLACDLTTSRRGFVSAVCVSGVRFSDSPLSKKWEVRGSNERGPKDGWDAHEQADRDDMSGGDDACGESVSISEMRSARYSFYPYSCLNKHDISRERNQTQTVSPSDGTGHGPLHLNEPARHANGPTEHGARTFPRRLLVAASPCHRARPASPCALQGRTTLTAAPAERFAFGFAFSREHSMLFKTRVRIRRVPR